MLQRRRIVVISLGALSFRDMLNPQKTFQREAMLKRIRETGSGDSAA
jgi:hypothetical protein